MTTATLTKVVRRITEAQLRQVRDRITRELDHRPMSDLNVSDLYVRLLLEERQLMDELEQLRSA